MMHVPDIAYDEAAAERYDPDYRDVVMEPDIRKAADNNRQRASLLAGCLGGTESASWIRASR